MDAPLCKGKGASNSMLWDSAISIECVVVCKKNKTRLRNQLGRVSVR
jgi:hypothetical protein